MSKVLIDGSAMSTEPMLKVAISELASDLTSQAKWDIYHALSGVVRERIRATYPEGTGGISITSVEAQSLIDNIVAEEIASIKAAGI